MQYKTHSLEETQNVAAEIAQQFKNKGGLIALEGDLGAGKTTFTQGFARALDIDKIISPTFVLVRVHPIPNSERTLFHIDLYRLEGQIKIEELGIKDMLSDPDNIIIIEWAEKLGNQLPKDAMKIKIEKVSENERNILVI